METVVTENPTLDRVKAALHRSIVGTATVLVPVIAAPEKVQTLPPQETTPAPAATESAMAPGEALQVLALAQRTAENHLTEANRHALAVRAEAQALAEQIQAEAHSYAEKVRGEADRLLDEALAAADVRRHDADEECAEIRRQAASVLADARAEAERIVAEGRDRAGQLDLRAQQNYEDAVGGLEIKRLALQKQIEMLAIFDGDYRNRLASFIHEQLRALWTERAEAGAGQEVGVPLPGGPVDLPEGS
jgi:cell division septum initiation protein DivIVA